MANIASNHMYLTVYSKNDYQEMMELLKVHVELDYEEEEPEDYPARVELNFDTKWGVHRDLLIKLVREFPSILWSLSCCEPGYGYQALCWYDAQEDDWFGDSIIHIEETSL